MRLLRRNDPKQMQWISLMTTLNSLSISNLKKTRMPHFYQQLWLLKRRSSISQFVSPGINPNEIELPCSQGKLQHLRWNMTTVDTSLKPMYMSCPDLSRYPYSPRSTCSSTRGLSLKWTCSLGSHSPEAEPRMGVLGHGIYRGLLTGEICKRMRKTELWRKQDVI